MIRGIGVDIVEVSRFAAQLERTPALRERLFTEQERGLPIRSLAARFAAKEAVAKALGGPPGMVWHDCWVPRPEHGDGRPELVVTGTVEDCARQRGISSWHLSLSHDGDMAIAMVVAEG